MIPEQIPPMSGVLKKEFDKGEGDRGELSPQVPMTQAGAAIFRPKDSKLNGGMYYNSIKMTHSTS